MELPLTDFRRRLWELAKNQFPGEYVGDIDVLARIDPKERWTWLRTTFLEEAGKRIKMEDAGSMVCTIARTNATARSAN
jgi:hypothetical protein